MAVSFATFEGLFRLKYNGIAQADLVVLWNDVHAEVTSRTQLYDETTEDVTWTAADVTNGVRRWALAAAVRRIWDARYYTAANTSTPLTRTNKHKLDALFPGWRDQGAGTPSHWFEDGGYIGLYLKPDTAPTGGYPKVVLYTYEITALTSSSTFPAQIASIDAWLYGCLFKYARFRDEANAAGYLDLYKRATHQLVIDIKAINARDFASAVSTVPAVRNL